MKKTICELFAGVGGFRLGFERLEAGFETVWFSQWEPGAKKQWAHDCYVRHFGECADRRGEIHTGEDISAMEKSQIPAHTVLVGGFLCQNYSVAHTLASRKACCGGRSATRWRRAKRRSAYSRTSTGCCACPRSSAGAIWGSFWRA